MDNRYERLPPDYEIPEEQELLTEENIANQREIDLLKSHSGKVYRLSDTDYLLTSNPEGENWRITVNISFDEQRTSKDPCN
jgi:hypothetical protein